MSSALKVLMVTGAGRGIGAATAKLAARQGYTVGVNYRKDATMAESVVNTIKATGGEAMAVQGDVSKEEDVVRLFKNMDDAFGRLDGLVNNAGISGGCSDVSGITLDILQDVFTTNVFGSFLCAREALMRMSTKNGGSGGAIVNVSSQAASFGGKKLTHYAASKGAINAFTIGLAREAAPLGVRVNAVSPGVIDTDNLKNMTPKQINSRLESIPMGRAGTPEEVAETILWLLSDQAAYINGAVLPISGGR